MTRKQAVFVAGSPSPSSRSAKILGAVREQLEGLGYGVRTFGVGDFDAQAVFEGRSDHASIGRYLKDVQEAAVFVVATPVYKATYSGALKSLLDLIGPEGLVGRVVLGIGTGRQPAHLAATGRALGAVFDFFRVGVVVPPILLTDDVVFAADGVTLSAEAQAAIDQSVRDIVAGVGDRT